MGTQTGAPTGQLSPTEVCGEPLFIDKRNSLTSSYGDKAYKHGQLPCVYIICIAWIHTQSLSLGVSRNERKFNDQKPYTSLDNK